MNESQLGSQFSSKNSIKSSVSSFYKTGYNHLKALEEVVDSNENKNKIKNYKIQYGKGYNLTIDYEEIKILKKKEMEEKFSVLKDDGRGPKNLSNNIIKQILYDRENPTKIHHKSLSNDIEDTKLLLKDLSFEDQLKYFELNKEERLSFIKEKKFNIVNKDKIENIKIDKNEEMKSPLLLDKQIKEDINNKELENYNNENIDNIDEKELENLISKQIESDISLITSKLPAYQSLIKKYEASFSSIDQSNPKRKSNLKQLILILSKALRLNDATLVTLNLKNLFINDQHLRIISSNIKYHNHLRLINLYNNKISDTGLSILIYALLNNQHYLNTLILGKNYITDDSIKLIVDVYIIRKSNSEKSPLKVLNLNCKRLSNVEFNIKRKKIIWNLYQFNKLNKEKLINTSLNQLLTNADNDIDNDNNNDNDIDHENDNNNMENNENILQNNELQTKEMQTQSKLDNEEENILNRILEVQKELEDDRYISIPYFSSNVGTYLAKAIVSESCSLESIHLSHHKLYDLGASKIFQSIRQKKNYSSLIELDLSYNSLTDDICIDIFKSLLSIDMTFEETKKFFMTDLTLDNINENDIKKILLKEKVENKLEVLNLSGNLITSKGALLIAHAVSFNKVIKKIDLSHCLIDEIGILALQTSMFWNHKLITTIENELKEAKELEKKLLEEIENASKKITSSLNFNSSRTSSISSSISSSTSSPSSSPSSSFLYSRRKNNKNNSKQNKEKNNKVKKEFKLKEIEINVNNNDEIVKNTKINKELICYYDKIHINKEDIKSFNLKNELNCLCCRGLKGIQSINTIGNFNIFPHLKKEYDQDNDTNIENNEDNINNNANNVNNVSISENIDISDFNKIISPSILNYFDQVSSINSLSSLQNNLKNTNSLPSIYKDNDDQENILIEKNNNSITSILNELELYHENPFDLTLSHQYLYFTNKINSLLDKEDKINEGNNDSSSIIIKDNNNENSLISSISTSSSLSLIDRYNSNQIANTIPKGLHQIRAYETTPLTDNNSYLLYLKTLDESSLTSDNNSIKYISFVSSYWEQQRQREILSSLRQSSKFKKLKKQTMILRALRAKNEKAVVAKVPESFYNEWKIKVSIYFLFLLFFLIFFSRFLLLFRWIKCIPKVSIEPLLLKVQNFKILSYQI